MEGKDTMGQPERPINPKDLEIKPAERRGIFGLGNPFRKGRTLAPAGIPVETNTFQRKDTQDPKKANINQATLKEPKTAGLTDKQAEKLREQSQREQNPHRLRKLLVRAGLATGVLGLGGYLGNEVYQNVQAQERPLPAETNMVSSNGEIDTTFQRTSPEIAKKFPIVVPKESFTPVTQDEMQNLWEEIEPVDFENNTIAIGFPVNQEDLARAGEIRIDEKFDAILPPYIDKQALEQQGIKNIKYWSGFAKDSKIRFDFDSNKFDASVIIYSIAGQTKETSGNTFTPAYTSARVMLRNKETGQTSALTMRGLWASPLIEVKGFPSGSSPVIEDGIRIEPNTPIFQLTTDLQDWDGNGQILLGDKGQLIMQAFYEQMEPRRAPIPLTPNLMQTSGNTTPISQ